MVTSTFALLSLWSEMDASWPPLPGDYLDIPEALPRIL